ncbi:MAG: pyruvate formate lyase family protein [Pseudomonadota bacterium]
MGMHTQLHQALNLLLMMSPKQLAAERGNPKLLNRITHIALRMMAIQFNLRPSLKKYMKGKDGWINFSVGFRSAARNVEQAIIFHDGRVRVQGSIPENVDVTMIFQDGDALKEMAFSTPNEMLKLKRSHRNDIRQRKITYGGCNPGLSKTLTSRKHYRMRGKAGADPNVLFLSDPYLSEYSMEDFPRLKKFFDFHFDARPEICAERPRILTDWYRENGFECNRQGDPWFPETRQGLAFQHLMKHKKPVIRKDDLLAGTTTAKEAGVTIFPDGQGNMIWGELNSLEQRILIPFSCSRETAETLHHDVLPFWMHRNFKEYVRNHFHYPICQKLDERFVAYFVWKSVGISHTIPNLKRVLDKGISGIIADIQNRLTDNSLATMQKQTLQAMIHTLKGVVQYAENLAQEAVRLEQKELNPQRKEELQHLARICRNVPRKPAETLDEAVNTIWIVWVALHMENANTGLSLGRLDQWLQPYFRKDMEKKDTDAEKEDYVQHAVELTGCLIMRLTDHVPLLPDIANYLFGGAASTQAITLGGVTPEGEDGVNDMTYIFLKAVELLPVRDTNINARYHVKQNSDNYLKRLCEVNIITSATPIMQSDTAMEKALTPHGYTAEEIHDWAATGCVEPSIQGRHFGHTGSILLNLVAALEIALNNGTHPLMQWKVGPETGSIEKGDFPAFEDFFQAWKIQQQFIIDQAVELNNMLGRAHQELRPTPLLSALIDGCIESGRDLVHGGAQHNTSGTSNIGLVDVTDSMMVIKKLVFDEQRISFAELKKAVDSDFRNNPALHAMVQNRVPLFGSGDPEALAMCRRITETIHDCWRKHKNIRGGKYTVGFWSMSQHVAYGSLSGTLPSGRLAGKAFTPGLTPSPRASRNFLDNLTAVAGLPPEHMDNNIAFNVKLTPHADDTRETTTDNMHAYVKAYFEQGGMQMQFNVVTSEMLKDAMAHPDNYRNLMVRISGYNAYFVALNKEIQIELIERTEYGL